MTVGDTAAISQGVGAFASRQAINAGSSALLAGQSVKKQIVALAALTLGIPESDIDLDEGRAIARTGNKPILSFGELAKLAQGVPGVSFAPGQTPGLEHTAYFTPPQASYCNGTHVVEAEVDPLTGGVTLLRYTVGHDSGVIINPLIVDGQVVGGVAQGIGGTLYELLAYGDEGQPVATSFMDYLIPTAAEIPTTACLRPMPPDFCTPHGIADAAQSARRQGRGRRRYDSRARRDHRRDRGCALTLRRALRRGAAHAGAHRRAAAASGRV